MIRIPPDVAEKLLRTFNVPITDANIIQAQELIGEAIVRLNKENDNEVREESS